MHMFSRSRRELRERDADEVITAASWLGTETGLPIITEAGRQGLDEWIQPVFNAAITFLAGNKASVVMPEDVKAVREATKGQAGFYNPADLLKQFPN